MGVLLGPDDTVLGSVRLPTTRGVDGVVTTATKAVRALMDDAAIGPGALVAAGIGIPGVVDPETGTVTHPVNLGFPDGLTPLAQLLSDALDGIRVQVENDLIVAALGTARALGDPNDLAFLAMGTGLAAGFPLQEPPSTLGGLAPATYHHPSRCLPPPSRCSTRRLRDRRSLNSVNAKNRTWSLCSRAAITAPLSSLTYSASPALLSIGHRSRHVIGVGTTVG